MILLLVVGVGVGDDAAAVGVVMCKPTVVTMMLSRMMSITLTVILLASLRIGGCDGFLSGKAVSGNQIRHVCLATTRLWNSKAHGNDAGEEIAQNGGADDTNRRRQLFQSAPFVALSSIGIEKANAYNPKSRSEGYDVQKSDEEWTKELTPMQDYILRNGGTEKPYSSILEAEERGGTYSCAGCGTDLFESKQKFHSGTGWPSFARALPGVEIQDVGAVQLNLLGAELRCKTCGGHLGDLFADGYLFVGTPAFTSGKRFCIDGGALVFQPNDGSTVVRGDLPPKAAGTPDWLAPPKIDARDRSS